MLNIGCHLSTAKGLAHMGREASSIGANTFAFFTRNPRGSRKDRHERIGQGAIGFDAIARIVRHPALRDLPFILETPNDLDGYADEIRLLRELAG